MTLLMALGVMAGCTASHDDSSDGWVMVYTDAGAIQCEYGGRTLEQTAALLQEYDVAVQDSACGYLTDRAVIAVCGAGTMDINLHRIGAADLGGAMQAGFHSVDELESGAGPGYERVDCTGRGETTDAGHVTVMRE